jgi:hypothetical protein
MFFCTPSASDIRNCFSWILAPVVFGSTLALTSCGGGGGGSDFFGAGVVSIAISPSDIDVGDQARVRVQVSEANEDGIILKVRFPDGLRYVPNSSVFEPNDQSEVDFAPDVNVTTDGDVYLVFFMNDDEFGTKHSGELQFQLEGISEVDDGRVEVDIDVDDLEIPNQNEFNVEDPEFQEEDSSRVDVQS